MPLATTILFQASGGGFGSLIISMAPLFLIFGVFYVLIILPQRRKQRELQAMIDSLKAGDRIITTGGIIATITAVRDRTLIIRSADKSILEISRGAVAGVPEDEEKKPT
jgi:preprotein translocase subunit YajC